MSPSSTNSATRKTALVTGSSNGIGEAIVKELAKLDYKLVVTGRCETDIKRVADECELLSPSHLRPLDIIADLAHESDIERLFRESLAHFNQRLDLLVNNAGLSAPTGLQDVRKCYENFKRTLEVNLNSACHLSLLAAEPLRQTAMAATAMAEADGQPYNSITATTSIVNISSIAAVKPLDDFAYCVSKCGLSMLSNCLAGKLGPAVRVNCINPGPIETKIIERAGQVAPAQFKAVVEQVAPLKRMGGAEEIARAVLFLADHEQASYITGAQLNIDGGVLCSSVKF